ncbi:TRAP transporter permease [Spartinivicinus poritis]|uniref:TRAP transporter permease n=1 Tax=Spartinivicinus poritis TaxID=2994640 RepID=A0ABT5UGE3_9GAMM|nr:TRAP transporter permease [Spartinivicinus sp. A2-2]MDE1465061.1 TRAP transporter permease [Spartinivicinus sp. A2-2]
MYNTINEPLDKYRASSQDSIKYTRYIVYFLAIALSLTHIYFNTFSTLSELWISAIHFSGFGLLCILTVPIVKNESDGGRSWKIVDVFLAGIVVVSAGYLILFEDQLYARGVELSQWDWWVAIASITVALELTRRTMGWFIPVLTLVALSYVVWWGKLISGPFHFPGLSLETLLYRSYFSPEGMFGPIARISWSYVFMFILFGSFLVQSGAGDFIIKLARAAAGRFTGGPGFVAVLGSGLMGSVSGSSVANTVSTGVITIPLMKQAGFPARFAAGVEAAASTGGQLMPPVMGAGAFIMANYTQLSYLEIMGAATLPALLYFLSVAFFVRIEAKRQGLHATDETKINENQESIGKLLKSGWHFTLPIASLVAMLIYGFTPTYAAGFSILVVIASTWLTAAPMKLPQVTQAMVLGSKNMAATAMLLVTIGLVVNTVATTGVGNTFSLMITDWAGGSLLVTIVLVALASLILGMGLPVTASYIILATLAAPAIYNLIAEAQLLELLMSGQIPEQIKPMLMLVAPEQAQQFGSVMSLTDAQALIALIPADLKNTLIDSAIDPTQLTLALLSAHMIIFWLSQDSNVTPPVCLTAFAAAAIAKTSPMRTGFAAWKIAKGLYIVPLLFAYTPLLSSDLSKALPVFITALLGIYALAAALEGYLESTLSWMQRLVALASGVSLLWPQQNIWLTIIGVSAFVGLFYWSFNKSKIKLKE